MEGGKLNIPVLVILAFIVYRLAYMLAIEEGPFGVFPFWRGLVDPDQKTWLGRGLNCPLCISFWLALPAALSSLSLPYQPIEFLYHWFAIAGIATFLERISD